jgi:hypothetical protein
VQVGAQRNRRVEPHPAQRAAPGSASVQPRHYVLWSALRWVSRPARLARALDVERVAWPRGEAQPCPGCGLRGRVPFLRANRRATLLTTRQDGTRDLQHERGGTEVRASVGPYIMSVMKNMYQKSLATIIGQARARAAECMLIPSFGSVRSATRVAPPITKCQVVCRMLAGSPRRPLCSTSP